MPTASRWRFDTQSVAYGTLTSGNVVCSRRCWVKMLPLMIMMMMMIIIMMMMMMMLVLVLADDEDDIYFV